jgi:hypothetical protein
MKSTLTKLILVMCVLVLFLSCSKEMPVISQQGENTGSSSLLSKKPEGGGGPSTRIGTATLTDGMLISSDGEGAYIDCGIIDEYGDPPGTDKVEVEVDGKGQLQRVEIFCGQHCQDACSGLISSRTVDMNLSGGNSLVEDNTTAAALLTAIESAADQQVLIQFWPVSKNNWTSLIICMASSVTWEVLINEPYSIDPGNLEKYKFWGGPVDCEMGGDDDPLMYGVKHASVNVELNADGSWTITPLAVPNDPVKVYVMMKRKSNNRFWTPEFLATYPNIDEFTSGLPFEITVTAN